MSCIIWIIVGLVVWIAIAIVVGMWVGYMGEGN